MQIFIRRKYLEQLLHRSTRRIAIFQPGNHGLIDAKIVGHPGLGPAQFTAQTFDFCGIYFGHVLHHMRNAFETSSEIPLCSAATIYLVCYAKRIMFTSSKQWSTDMASPALRHTPTDVLERAYREAIELADGQGFALDEALEKSFAGDFLDEVKLYILREYGRRT